MAVFHTISAQEAKHLMDTRKDCVIVDVREEDEYIIEHIEDSILFTLAEINEETAAEILPDKNALLLVYCKTGKRSHTACHILAGLGYTQVYDFGGMINWSYGFTWE